MKRRNYISLTVFCTLLCACNSNQKEKPESELYEPVKAAPIDLVEKGRYIVSTNGCHDCHSPKRMTEKGPELIPDKILSGHPSDLELPPYDEKTAQSYILFSPGLTSATGPWGTSFAANLTPDATGIGSWTEEQFFTAIRKGLYKGLEGSRPLLPPMPWQDFANFTDEDLSAIFAYLKSLKPVENMVPSPIPPKQPNT